MKQWLCILLIFLPGMLFAADKNHAVKIISPKVPQSWSYGEMKDHRLIWDGKRKEFRAELTFSEGVYADYNNPVWDQEVYECPFPGVRLDSTGTLLVAKSPKGFDVPVAKRSKSLFDYQIDLLPTSRVIIYNIHGKLIVVLAGTTDHAYATGMNKWIVKKSGWYLENVF